MVFLMAFLMADGWVMHKNLSLKGKQQTIVNNPNAKEQKKKLIWGGAHVWLVS